MTKLYTPDQAFQLAQEHHQQGRLVEAEHLYRQLLDIAPNHESLNRLLGILCCQLGRVNEGIRLLRKTISLNAEQPLAHLQLGQALIDKKLLQEASNSLSSAIEMDRCLLPAWSALSRVADETGDWRLKLHCLWNIAVIFPEADFSPPFQHRTFSYLLEMISYNRVTATEVLKLWQRESLPFAELFSIFASVFEEEAPDPGRADTSADHATLIETANASIASNPLDSLECIFRALLWRGLVEAGWYTAEPDLPAPFNYRHLLCILEDAHLLGMHKMAVLDVLGYSLESPREWNSRIFHDLILQALRVWPDSANLALAYWLESKTAFSFAQQPITVAQAKYCYSQVADIFSALGEKFACADGMPAHLAGNQPPVIAFISNAVINDCAPDQLIFNLLRGWSASTRLFFSPLLISYNQISEYMAAKFSSINVPIIDMAAIRNKPDREDNFDQRLRTLRDLLISHKVTALIFYNCTDGFSVLTASARLAPVQINFSMGYHYMDGEEWDGFITGGSNGQRFKQVEDRAWRVMSIAHPDPYADDKGLALREQGKLLKRSQFAHYPVVLASIGRAQKIDNDQFIDALALILRKNPTAVFLWFGEQELVSVSEKMARRGITERCLFQGWVNVHLYAQVIDIHLDSFPYPSGLAMFDSMSAGVASVFMDTEEARQTGIIIHLASLLRGEAASRKDHAMAKIIFTDKKSGESLFLLAKTTDEYITYTQKLIDDTQFRKAVGDANLKFMQHFKFDLRRPVKEFHDHIVEIIEEKREKLLTRSPYPPSDASDNAQLIWSPLTHHQAAR